jgi:hypothetical protein
VVGRGPHDQTASVAPRPGETPVFQDDGAKPREPFAEEGLRRRRERLARFLRIGIVVEEQGGAVGVSREIRASLGEAIEETQGAAVVRIGGEKTGAGVERARKVGGKLGGSGDAISQRG